jgi:hypothetical protein
MSKTRVTPKTSGILVTHILTLLPLIYLLVTLAKLRKQATEMNQETNPNQSHPHQSIYLVRGIQ